MHLIKLSFEIFIVLFNLFGVSMLITISLKFQYNTIKENTELSSADKKSIKKDIDYLDKYYEEKLHIECIRALRNMKQHAFVMNGFQSASCLLIKLEKCRKTRNKNQFDDLNKHEKDVMDILEIQEIPEEILHNCLEEHKRLLEGLKLNDKLDSYWFLDKVSPVLIFLLLFVFNKFDTYFIHILKYILFLIIFLKQNSQINFDIK